MRSVVLMETIAPCYGILSEEMKKFNPRIIVDKNNNKNINGLEEKNGNVNVDRMSIDSISNDKNSNSLQFDNKANQSNEQKESSGNRISNKRVFNQIDSDVDILNQRPQKKYCLRTRSKVANYKF